MKRILCGLIAQGLLLGVPGLAMAQPSYIYTILNVPGPSPTVTIPHGISNAGQVVGHYVPDATGLTHGFVFDSGSYTKFDVPDSHLTQPSGINAAGQIVGIYEDQLGFVQHGFL